MKHTSNVLLFAVMIVAAAFLAGCAPAPVQETQEAAQPAPEAEKVAPQITFEASPTSAAAGQEIAISWKVSGEAAQIQHTAIHYGPQSVSNPTGPRDYPSATTFQCQTTPCSIPNTFSARLKIDTPGTYYYRAHIIIDEKDVWSEEKAITIVAQAQATQPPAPAPEGGSTITITSAPASAATSQEVAISWRIDGKNATIPHTAVHYGTSSVANPAGPADYPLASTFLCTTRPCKIPGQFLANIKINETGTYYYRAHAIIDGENIWSEEKTIEIVTPAEAPARSYSYGGY